jgi:hypothetical protein
MFYNVQKIGHTAQTSAPLLTVMAAARLERKKNHQPSGHVKETFLIAGRGSNTSQQQEDVTSRGHKNFFLALPAVNTIITIPSRKKN